MPLRAILFDFGGTLDSPGLHCSTQLANGFAASGYELPRERFDPAFVATDKALGAQPDIARLGLRAHVRRHAELTLEALDLPLDPAEAAADQVVARAATYLRASRELLARHRDRFRYAIVSNYTPNLPLILEEAELAGLFDAVMVSDLCGVKKPDPAIFRLALAALDVAPADAAMVGDSLPADIAPAKALGLTTVWLRGDRVYGAPADPAAADHVVSDLAAVFGVLAGLAS